MVTLQYPLTNFDRLECFNNHHFAAAMAAGYDSAFN